MALPTQTPPTGTPQPQAVTAQLTGAAIFLVLTVGPGAAAETAVRGVFADLSSLVRAVGFRDPAAGLSCVTGIGSDLWDRLFGLPRPKGLHRFRQIDGVHHAPSTPGDILFHIRASGMDMCFELANVLVQRLGGAAQVADEVHGFKYFDNRDLLGFVDGTENPAGRAALDAALIGDEDPDFAGGSYVIVQKYLHDLKRWNAQPVEAQEDVIGRAKLSDIEQADEAKKPYAHNVLTNIEDENGVQLQIIRDNMPFGDVGRGEFGTYFIGYSCEPGRTERMLDNMFIGDPPGNYDRLLDFSTAATGCLFFVPTVDFLDNAESMAIVEGDAGAPQEPKTAPDAARQDGSLGIGSLKG